MVIKTWAAFSRATDSEKKFIATILAAEVANPENIRVIYIGTSPGPFANYYHSVLKGVSRLKRSLQTAFSGQTAISWGTIKWRREDGDKLTPDQTIDVDDLLSGVWTVDGRPLEIRYGGEKLPESEYQPIFKGTAGRIKSWGRTSFDMEIVSPQQELKTLILNPNTISAGTNVPESSVGRVTPLALGRCKNISPILIDDANYTYLATDTTTAGYSGISAVYDNGVPVNFADNGNGAFTLAVAPVGTITCDINGAILSGSYKSTIAGIADGLVRVFAGLGDVSIDTLSVAACEAALPYTVGLYLNDSTDLLTALDKLMQGIPAWHSFTRTGTFRIGEFALPTGTPDIALSDMEARDVKGSSYEKLIWSQSILYDKNHTVISQPAGAVSQAQRAWLSEEYRTAKYADSGIQGVYPLADEADPLSTCLITQADASAVAAKWVSLFGQLRRQYSFKVPLSLEYELHQEVEFKYPKYGIQTGFKSRLISITEDYTNKKIELVLWG